MPVKSYLVHPEKGKKEVLAHSLMALNSCEVVKAENENLLILVTDTENEKEEKALKEKLDSMPGLLQMALVSGFDHSETEQL